jgi:hypothetical protein
LSYRYDVSYPFFDVAKRYGIEYADVLAAAVFLQFDKGNGHYPGPLLPDEVFEELVPLDAMMEIALLVDMPVHARGGRTDICDECGAQARSGDVMVCSGRVKLEGELTGYLIPENCLACELGYEVTA